MDRTLRNPAFIIDDHTESGVDVTLLSDSTSNAPNSPVVERTPASRDGLSWRTNYGAIDDILRGMPDGNAAPSQVFYESAGTARPWSVIAGLSQVEGFYLRHFIVTIDALSFHRDLADGRVLIGEAEMPNDIALSHTAETLAEQLLFASAIILTKTDTVPNDAVDEQIRVINALKPKSTIGLSTLNGFSLSHFDAALVPDVDELRKHAERFGLLNENRRSQDIVSMGFEDRRPFHPRRLYEVFQRQLGTSLFRTKGSLWLASRPSEILLWQQSGSQVRFEHVGSWKDVDEEHSDSPRQLKNGPTEKFHPIFGDRSNSLTLFGLPHACQIFAAALRGALCTDEEITAWRNGSVFPDPWPANQSLTS